ncbi:MAG: cytochrome c oxidase assembly protein, partial [Acidimicrobiales bacterium]
DVGTVAGSIERRLRTLALAAAAVAVVLVFVPPLWGGGRRYVFAETVQFCLVAFAVPGLLVVGRPWRWAAPGSRLRELAGRLGRARERHPSPARAGMFAAVEVGAMVAWRTQAAVDALTRHWWLVVAEVVSLTVVGVGLWLELVACPPLRPRVPRPGRAVLAAACMWATWILAYVIGFSHGEWYVALDRRGSLGWAADQQVAAGVLLLGALVAFMPVIFSDALAFLHGEGDPDAELRRLVRAERRAGRWRGPGG